MLVKPTDINAAPIPCQKLGSGISDPIKKDTGKDNKLTLIIYFIKFLDKIELD